MKKYRFLKVLKKMEYYDGNFLVKGKVYPGYLKPKVDHISIGGLARRYPKDWELIPHVDPKTKSIRMLRKTI